MKVLLGVILFSVMLSRPVAAEHAPVVPIVITASDVEQCGGWPLSRRWYAAFIQQVRAGGADRVFIDIAFMSADPLHPESDAAFYDAMANDERIFLLHPATASDGGTVNILGNRPFPFVRTFTPLSRGMEFLGDRMVLRDTNSLTAALLRSRRGLNGMVIPPPERSLPSLRFVEVLKETPDLNGADVVLFLDYPGVTSFIVTPAGGQWSSTHVQIWAAELIQNGRFSRLLDRWLYLLIITVLILPAAAVMIIRRSRQGSVIAAAVAAGITASMWAGGLFLPQWFIVTVAVWCTGIIVVPMLGRRAAAKDAPMTRPAVPTAPGTQDEVEALRYQLKYYEQLTEQTPPDYGTEGTATADIIHHPQSPLKEILRKAAQIAASPLPVLLSGESGTGKELVAQFIHQQSPRSGRAFIAVNCSSLSDSLIESELFGHEQGSFTGAIKSKRGRFELADGGTLFLDEIGETSASFQAKILRALQEGVVERVGGTAGIRVDVRIIAATNKDLKEMTKNGDFREDLYYRLHGFELAIPALRERTMDIEALFRHFLFTSDPALSYSPQLIEWLKEQRWPGNVRQLQSAVQRAVLNARMHTRTFIVPKDLEIGSTPGTDPMEEGKRVAENVLRSLRSNQFDHRSIAQTSAELGLHRSTVTEYLRGWIIQSMERFPDDETALFTALLGPAAVEDEERFRTRIRSYVASIRTAIEEGQRAGETAESIAAQRFRKIPLPFRADIIRLAERHPATHNGRT